jgi:hypothetical protein
MSMPSSVPSPRSIHLVGSVPLANAEQVFRTAGSILSAYLHRVPDGETGERTFWAAFQLPMLARNPAFEARGAGVMRRMLRAYSSSRLVRRLVNAAAHRASGARARASTLRVRRGVTSADIRLGPLGYAAAARESFAVLRRLQQAGAVADHLRLQVSLPTPIAVVNAFPPEQQQLVLPAYEARLGTEIDDMLEVIPADRLAVQWDAAIEFAILEGVAPATYGSVAASRQPLLDTMVRLGHRVPRDVELGYHFCYGDAGHRHFIEPTDTARIVDAANFVASNLTRTLNWIHFPVPRARADDAYFAPLRDLDVSLETEVYAGLVHLTDGVPGTRRRLAAAKRALSRDFGIATECGMGRRDPRTIPGLMRVHVEVAAPAEFGVVA